MKAILVHGQQQKDKRSLWLLNTGGYTLLLWVNRMSAPQSRAGELLVWIGEVLRNTCGLVRTHESREDLSRGGPKL